MTTVKPDSFDCGTYQMLGSDPKSTQDNVQYQKLYFSLNKSPFQTFINFFVIVGLYYSLFKQIYVFFFLA